MPSHLTAAVFFLCGVSLKVHVCPCAWAKHLQGNSPLTYPLKSWSVTVSPNKLRKFLNAGLSSLFPNSSSSWVCKVYQTKDQCCEKLVCFLTVKLEDPI